MREYILGTGVGTISGTTTMNFIKNAAAPNINLEFLRYWVGQSSSTTSAQQRIAVQLASGSALVTSASPVKVKTQDTLTSIIVGGASGAAGTCGTNATTEPGAGTVVIADVFNVLNGWLNIPTPAETYILAAGLTSGLGFGTPTNPTGPLTGWAWGFCFREV